MINKLINTDITYIKCFSQYEEDEHTIRFWDDKLTNMYSHNFILLKHNMPDRELADLILKEIEQRKSDGRDFFRIEANFPINDKIVENIPYSAIVSKFDFMYISPDRYSELIGNDDCTILEALNQKVMEDGRKVDITASAPHMGEDFAHKRIDRKIQVYKSPEYNLNLFVVYHNGTAVGNCELFINGDTAKIEDFDILEQYQRRGFGTSMLKHLIRKSKDAGAGLAYVVTDSSDTAKDMYSKCGFTKIGEKMEIFFSF